MSEEKDKLINDIEQAKKSSAGNLFFKTETSIANDDKNVSKNIDEDSKVSDVHIEGKSTSRTDFSTSEKKEAKLTIMVEPSMKKILEKMAQEECLKTGVFIYRILHGITVDYTAKHDNKR